MARTIITYLTDWTVEWIKTIQFSNRLIKWLIIPRKDVTVAVKTRSEIEGSWIYFLFGENEKWENSCYIGQAKNLSSRIQQHSKDTWKDFRNTVLCFTHTDWTLDKTDINYLEREIISIAKKAKRYEITNWTDWNKGLMREHRISDMQDFIEDAKILLNSLWLPVLQELITNNEKWSTIESLYYLISRWSNAKWTFSTNGNFVVLEDSILSDNEIIPYQRDLWNLEKRRNILKEEGIIINNKFTKNYEFKTPTAACNIISWGNLNWRLEWKDSNWKTLDENIRKTTNL
jgi:predicted GIY-YIG superfamily endonuclease